MRRRFMSNKKTKSVKYCTITATQDNTSISSAYFLDIYYAINNTDYWSRGSTLIFATLNAGDSIYLKGIDFGVVNTGLNIDCDKDVILSGNILSLVFGDNNSNETSLSHTKSGIASFSNVIKVSSDFLPSKELGARCYEKMFANCPRLTQAPELPATTLAPSCYRGMFNGCSNLNYIKMLAIDISATGCLNNWVYGVSSTGTFVKSKDATWDTTPGALEDSGVPEGWKIEYDHNYDIGSDISFHIDRIDETLYAKDWMTWDDWAHSKYNTVSAHVGKYEIVIYSYSRYPLDINLDNIIKNGGTYYFRHFGGGSD